ncbi:MAG: hypothetical protein O2897_01630, partial [bacterium]|nr:hypothetical protein [bacterium]
MASLPAYELQTLFDLREKQKKDAEELYAKAQQLAIQAKAKQKEMEAELVKMNQFRDAKRLEYGNSMQKQVMTIEKIEINNNHLEMLEDKAENFVLEIDQQKNVVIQAEAAAAEELKKVLKATQDFKTLEKHKEKWLKKVQGIQTKK